MHAAQSAHQSSAIPVRRRAFTMIELVIVTLIMGILAAAAVPRFVDSLRFHSVQSAARRVKADLEHLRQTARLTSKTQTITFVGMTYSVAPTSDFKGLDGSNAPYTVNLVAPPYELDSIAVDFDDDTVISFGPYGMPLEPGEILLAADPHECRIVVNALGNIEIVVDEN